MKNLILTLALMMTAVAFVSYAPAPANADDTDAISVVGWGRNYAEAEERAFRKAANYEPYEVDEKEFGWDPTHIPHNYQYYCKLWIIPLTPGQ